MYKALREAIPIIDAAIGKIVRLVGGVQVKCSDKTAEKLLNDFLSTVPTGPVSSGIESFISSTVDRLLTYGTAVNELVLDRNGRLSALYTAALENLELSVEENPLCPVIRTAGGEKVPHPERITVTALSPEPDSAYGISILRGLPFVSEVLLKIYNTIGVNFERLGNLRFAVTYRPSDTQGISENRADEIASAWSDAMRDTGTVKDFVAVGDVDIKVIGGDAIMPDIEVPIRTLTEQIIAKTGLPPFCQVGASQHAEEGKPLLRHACGAVAEAVPAVVGGRAVHVGNAHIRPHPGGIHHKAGQNGFLAGIADAAEQDFRAVVSHVVVEESVGA